MRSSQVPVARTLVAALVVGAASMVGVFVGVRLAAAEPGGPTRHALTFSGVLHGTTAAGPRTLTFAFQKPGATCGPITVRADVEASGAFSVEVPLASCTAFFDGADVTYTVAEGATMLTDAPVRVNPVPYARFADQAGVANDCPAGYARITPDATVLAGNAVVLCRRGRDEVVKVGEGASAFWIDRYEATIWTTPEATGAPVNSEAVTLDTLVPRNGMWSSPAGTRPRPPAYALSVGGAFRPARNVSWFQASALCRASGKELPDGEEWLRAAHGTLDDETRCHIASTNTNARNTVDGARCHSIWGAQDMIGNVWEWTSVWYASVGQVTSPASGDRNALTGRRVMLEIDAWGAGFGSDGTWNISSVVHNTGDNQIGVPSVALRGGDWGNGPRAGVFALSLGSGPADLFGNVGFRCVVRR